MTTNNESNLSLELAWAKVLLKSCLDVLETHNEPIVKRLRNDVSDFLKDDYNLLKNQKKINISEGNVKDDNINVAQANSQDLTEQWKKGELKRGKKYWCKLTDETTEICYLWLQTNRFSTLTGYQSKCLPDDYISEVLAPVFSFEEWQELKLHDEKATIKLGEKIIENDKLKSLLKEWIHYYPIVLYEYEDTLKTKDIIELYDRTREVLK